MHVIQERSRFDRSVYPQISRLIDDFQPHVVQTHNVKSHFLWKSSGLYATRPWIAFHHGYTSTTPTMLLYNQLDRWSLRSADRVVTVCQAFAPQLQARGVDQDRIRILHNSVAPFAPVARETLTQIRQDWGISPETKILLCVGRFSKEKGQVDLMHALAHLRRSVPAGWKLVLLGSGPDRPALEALIERYELREYVHFAEFQHQPAALFFLADIFVLPSHSEGSSNVLLEAMATGLPIAATAVGGNPEIVRHEETALLMPPRQPQAMAEALGRLLKDADLRTRLGTAARAHAAEAFSADAYRQRLLSVYREVLDPSASNSFARR